MRTQNARPVRLTPVDEERGRQVTDISDHGRLEALYDQNLFRLHVRRERSSAYWFAAAIWGICGLVIGACLGAYLMYVASVSTLPTAVDAVAKGQALGEIQSNREKNGPAINLDDGQ